MTGVKGKSGGKRPNQTGRPKIGKAYHIRLQEQVWRWYRQHGGSAYARAVLTAHMRATQNE